MEPTLLIMAAGIGSRYGGLKQLDPVGPSGEIIIDYSIYDALRAGFRRVVFVIRRAIEEEFRRTVSRRFANRIEMDYVHQELDCLPAGCAVRANRSKPWGTGHALWVAREKLTGPFAVINSDDFYGLGAFQALASFLRQIPAESTEYAMVGYTLRDTLSENGAVTRGLCELDGNGYLKRIVETKHIVPSPDGRGACYTDASGVVHRLTGDECVSMNAWAFTPSLFPFLEEELRKFLAEQQDNSAAEFYIPGVIGQLIDRNLVRVRVLPGGDVWHGITYREDKPFVEEALRKMTRSGLYPVPLWADQ